MDSFEWNKIFASVLVALIVIMLGSFTADGIISPEILEKNVYVVDIPDDGAAVQTTKKGLEPITPLLAAASVENGQKIFKKCIQCHTPNKGGKSKTGPNLWNIVGKKFASFANFAYSSGIKAMDPGLVWGFEELNKFLYKPREYIKGTKMSFVGLKSDQDRADVIAYLNSLHDTPKPLK